MKFGIQLDMFEPGPGQNTWDTMLAIAQAAEVAGFDSIWYEDHFMWRNDEQPDQGYGNLECLTVLSALAAATERLQIGSLVLGAPYRNPALLAKIWTTLDIISHGRAIAGIGAGWHEQEFTAYGWDFGTVRQRMEKLGDTACILDRMMRQLVSSYTGTWSTIDRAVNHPQPVQRPRPPILIGGNGEKRTLRLVAQYADMCNVFGSVDEVAQRFDTLRRHCDDVGRPPSEVTRTINYWAYVVRNEQDRAATKERYPAAWSVDTVDETVENLKKYEAVGTQYVILKLMNAPDIEPIQLFAEQVIPAFGPDAS